MSRRRYVVTGSASGIGAATVTMLRDLGAEVIGCDLTDADVIADLSTSVGRQALIEKVATWGPIDAVLAIAGGGRTRLLETNYFGAVATLEGLRPMLSLGVAPRAVAVSSTASLEPADDRVLQACWAGDEAAGVSTTPGATTLSGIPAPAHALVGAARRTQPFSARFAMP